MKQWNKKENVFSDKYYPYEEKKMTVSNLFSKDDIAKYIANFDFQTVENFYNTHVICQYYCRKADNKWIGDSFIRNIRFRGYDLEQTETIPLYEEYRYEKWIELPFYTDDEKQRAFNTIVEQYKFKTEQEQKKKQQELENELKEKSQHDIAYYIAKSSNNINDLTSYIRNNYHSKYFNKEVYTEIAKLISKKDNVVLESLSAYTQPHDSEENYLYYDEHINVTLRINDGSFLAKSSFGDLIFISNVYDQVEISYHITNVYLKRIGDYEYSTSDGTESIPQFDLIYSF